MKKINELRFGTGGIPVSTIPRNVLNGVNQVRKLNLSAMLSIARKGIQIFKNPLTSEILISKTKLF